MVRGSLIAVLVLTCAVMTGWTQDSSVIVLYSNSAQNTASVPCYFVAPEFLNMTRVDLKTEQAAIEVDGSQPFYVRHGWGPGWTSQCLGGLDHPALGSYLLGHLGYELRLNGALVAPTYLTVDPGTGAVYWCFEFAAGALRAGVYIFESRHIRCGVLCSCLMPEYCDPGQESLPNVDAPRALTVTVLYPPVQ